MRCTATALYALTTGVVTAQFGLTLPTLEALVANADLVVRGQVSSVERRGESDGRAWIDVTLQVEESLKGPTVNEVTFAVETTAGDQRWEQFAAAAQEQIWFLLKRGRAVPGEAPGEKKHHARHVYRPAQYWPRLRLGKEVQDESSFTNPPPPIFTMHFAVLEKRGEILAAIRTAVAAEPKKRPAQTSIDIPRSLAQRTGSSGDANSAIVPVDSRLEAVAWHLIDSPEDLLPSADDWPAKTAAERESNETWLRFSANRLRAEGARTLRFFKSDENIGRLKALLDHPASVGNAEVEEKEFYVRKAAFETLQEWKIAIEKPMLYEGRDARRPKSDKDQRAWLQNMVWHHGFSHTEIAAATGMERNEIEKALDRFKIYWNTKPERPEGAPLLVLPYPGGRHPRIGFLDGAVKPQRETKISIFTPWDEKSYVVADIPEAIWSNLGLTYLAHTHVPTVWTEQDVELDPLEWSRHTDGTLEMRRKLPNGIEFGTVVAPKREAVRMEMWLKNGTEESLTGMRVQNCVMLKGAKGFTALTKENKVFAAPYAAVHDESKERWIITAWDPCHRPWGNAKCPCLHSDPKFPDCDPGETRHLRGWLSFYEGDDIQAEFERIEKTGWRKASP